MSATVVPRERFETRDCRTYSCNRDAEPGLDYCAFCLAVVHHAATAPPDPPVGLREAILDLIPPLGRYEFEAGRGRGEDFMAARRELREAMKRAVKAVALT